MKIWKRMVSLACALLLLFGVCACEKEEKTVEKNDSVQTPLYQIADTVKADLMWDTETLFETVPETKAVTDIKLAKGIEGFKFKSAGYQGKANTWVFGAVGTPTTEMPEGGYPAVVLIHGGAGYVFRDWILYWMRKGFVAIAIDMFGNELNENLQKTANPDGGPKENDGSNFDSVENVTDSWVYHSIYNTVLAHNLLRAREDVDDTRIVATGISWGGYITNILSGVDKRFSAFAPVYGSGFVYEDSFWTDREGTFGGEDRQAWIDLYDPSSYLPYSVRPMLFVSGMDDQCFGAANRAKSASLVKGKTFFSQRSDLKHGNFWDTTYEIYAFFRHVLYGEDTLTLFGDTVVTNGKVTLNTENNRFHTVNLLYTLSTDEDSHAWEWKVLPILADDGKYTCELPAGTTAFVLETVGDIVAKDHDGDFRQSTPICFTAK